MCTHYPPGLLHSVFPLRALTTTHNTNPAARGAQKAQALRSSPPHLCARAGPPDRWHVRSAHPLLGCPSAQVHIPRALGLQRANCVCPTRPRLHTAVKATSGKQSWATPVVPPGPLTGFHLFACHRTCCSLCPQSAPKREDTRACLTRTLQAWASAWHSHLAPCHRPGGFSTRELGTLASRE